MAAAADVLRVVWQKSSQFGLLFSPVPLAILCSGPAALSCMRANTPNHPFHSPQLSNPGAFWHCLTAVLGLLKIVAFFLEARLTMEPVPLTQHLHLL